MNNISWRNKLLGEIAIKMFISVQIFLEQRVTYMWILWDVSQPLLKAAHPHIWSIKTLKSDVMDSGFIIWILRSGPWRSGLKQLQFVVWRQGRSFDHFSAHEHFLKHRTNADHVTRWKTTDSDRLLTREDIKQSGQILKFFYCICLNVTCSCCVKQ